MHDRRVAIKTVHPIWAVGIRSFAFLRKEVVEIVRQPRLIALLVLGPFALLLMFGSGYAETSIAKRAIFVGPAGSIYEDVLAGYEDQLADFIDSKGMVATEAEGRAVLDRGDADVVVVFPEDPEASVLRGERAVIKVLHNEIDPIQQGAVEVAARLAIQEVNATVLATLAGDAAGRTGIRRCVCRAAPDPRAAFDSDPAGAGGELRDELRRLEAALDGTNTILSRLRPDDPTLVGDVAERAGSPPTSTLASRRSTTAPATPSYKTWRLRSPRWQSGSTRSSCSIRTCWCAPSPARPTTSSGLRSVRPTTSRRLHWRCCSSTSRSRSRHSPWCAIAALVCSS